MVWLQLLVCQVRKCAAEQMYETLASAEPYEVGGPGLVRDDGSGQKAEECLAILAETAWNDDAGLDCLKAKRERLRELLGLPAIVTPVKAGSLTSSVLIC